jgi:drug/metabolite transporter (DMT)-like permease
VLSALRFSVVTVVALVVLAATRSPWRVARADWPRLVLSSLTGIALAQLLFIEAIHRTSAFAVNLLQGLEPLFAMAIVSLTGAEVVRRRQWLGAGLAFIGIVVFFLDTGGAIAFGLGELLGLAASFSFAAYGLVSAPLFRRYPNPTLLAYSMALGTLILLAAAAPELRSLDWASVSGRSLAVASASGVLSVYLGFWIWNWAIKCKGLAHASMYIFLDVVVSGVFAWIFLAERFGPLRIVGTVVVLIGLQLARSAGGAETTAVAPDTAVEAA